VNGVIAERKNPFGRWGQAAPSGRRFARVGQWKSRVAAHAAKGGREQAPARQMEAQTATWPTGFPGSELSKFSKLRPASYTGRTSTALRKRAWAEPSEKVGRGGASRSPLAVSSLDKATELLAQITADLAVLAQPALRIKAARSLRRAATDQSQVSPRIASVALLLSDALFNSPSIEITDERRDALRNGLDLLMDSFVPGDQEESFFRTLLSTGWQVTAPFDRDEFADLITQIDD
jgi:hypothetical protein